MTCRDRILSEDYADIIVNYILPEEVIPPRTVDSCYQRIDGDIGILYLNIAEAGDVSVSPFSYQAIPKCYGLMETPAFNQLSLLNSGIVSVQRPPLSLTGRGVTIAFLDTGIDYTQPVFRNSDGTSRIKAIWDQTIQTGDPPNGFLYGTEYDRNVLNAALLSPNPYDIVPSRDEIGHGTDIASVAAGSRLEEGRSFLGAAPDADIVMVKLREAKQYLRDYQLIPEGVPCYSESDVLMALKYIMSFHAPFIRPVVICFALGTNQGDHTGNSTLAEYLDFISSKRGMGVVICGGNEGNKAKHYQYVLPAANGTSTDEVEIKVAENDPGFMLEFWGNSPAIFSVSLRSPGGERVPKLAFRSTQTQVYQFVYEKTILEINYILVEQGTGNQLVQFRFREPTAGIWLITVTNETTNTEAPFSLWLPISQFGKPGTVFLRPTPYTTITEPGYAEEATTVSTYDDRNESLYIASGRGYSRDGRIKPDFASPGVGISTISGTQTGSSLAAAITAGAVADFLQWAVLEENDPLVDNNDIKNYFIRGASREKSITYPNREFGFGFLNLQGVFNVLTTP